MVGQKKQVTGMTDAVARNRTNLATWLGYTYTMDEQSVIAEQVTKTVYDIRDPETGALPEEDYVVNRAFQKAYTLRNRVSHTRYYEKLFLNELEIPQYPDYDNSSMYSYDIHGNVDTLLNHYKIGLMADGHGHNEFKTIAYKYDLTSGKVNEVHYQPGMADQFYHRYEYDADNKLTDVFTTDRKSSVGVTSLEEHDARYTYYRHGPLARTELGQQQVQGIDYAYTLQGWMKGVNSDSLVDEDGKSGSLVAKDAYRFSLNYFNGEYKAIGDAITNVIFPGHSGQLPTEGDYRPLYNGNITSMVVGIPKLGETKLYNYGYDQLNRLKSMDAYGGYNAIAGNWVGMQPGNDYRERISYDANGNIKTYKRNGIGVDSAMDNLSYRYYEAGGQITNNRLRHVKDAVTETALTEDLESQPDDNYEYDAIGNLTKDIKENISNIKWTVYGKIRSIEKTDGTIINYTYDVAGNRISKVISGSPAGKNGVTWYARDVQGIPMGVYSGTSTTLTLTEQPLYGSSRLGVWNRNINMDISVDENDNIFARGNKVFELSNHLGNVLVTVSDYKHGVDGDSDGDIDFYLPDVVTASDYAPFGMGLVGRKFDAGRYRYGFNGKENDNDIKGEANLQDYGLRIYDPRLGKFLSVDPLSNEFPWYSPYHFAGGNPIKNLDLDGGEPEDYVRNWVHRTMVINGYHRTDTEVEWDNQLGSYSYEAVYDETSRKHWFVMQKPNDQQHYYWKHIDGADPNRLIQSTTGKLDNGHWAPFETQDQAQARIGAEVATGLATFWYGMLSTAIATGGRGFIWLAETIIEELAGVPILNSPDDLTRRGGIKEGTNPGHNAADGLRLRKKLASEAQMAEDGEVIAGGTHSTTLRKAGDLAEQYGGEPEDWVKKRSSSYTAEDGTQFETHWEENLKTGQRVNMKTTELKRVSTQAPEPNPSTRPYGN